MTFDGLPFLLPSLMAQNPPSRTPPPQVPSVTEASMAKWTRILAFSTIGLMIFTAALVGTSVWAILTAQDQNATAIKAEIDASEQNKITQAAQFDTREQLRAVIGLAGLNGFASVNAPNNEPGFTTVATFQNYGGTRTEHFIAWASIHYFEKELPNGIDLTKPYDKVDLRDVIVGPGAPSPIAVFTTKKDVDAAVARQGVLVIWGLANYNDVFSPDQNHVVSFCYNVNVSSLNGQYIFNSSPLRAECNYSR